MKSTVVIYDPPRKGLPYLVVTFSGDQIQVVPNPTRVEARMMVSQLAPRRSHSSHAEQADTSKVEKPSTKT